jgi:hypothetical protein
MNLIDGTIRLLVCAMYSSALCACDGPLYDTVETAVEQYYHTECVPSIENDSTIDRNTAIEIAFSLGIDKSSFRVSGHLSSESDQPEWRIDEEGRDLVAIEPAEIWDLGSNRALLLEFTNVHGVSTDSYELRYNVVDRAIYVSERSGDDLNPGTPDLPMRSVQPAIDLAADLYDSAVVYVAEGTYESLRGGLSIADGISLAGSYSDSDWMQQSVDLYPTDLYLADAIRCVDISRDTGLSGLRIHTKHVGLSITNSTIRLDSIHVYVTESLTELGDFGARIQRSNVEIRDSIIRNVDSHSFRGIYAADSQMLISRVNVLCARVRHQGGVGIDLINSTATIEQCLIEGTSGGVDSWYYACIMLDFSEADIRNNILYLPVADLSNGIFMTASTAVIRNNTIIGTNGTPNDSDIGIYLRILSKAYIENNLIYLLNAGRCGIRQRDGNAVPLSVRNNAIFVGPQDGSAFIYRCYYDALTVEYNTQEDIVAFLHTLGVSTNEVQANILHADPTFVDGYDLGASTPGAISQGGMDLSEHFATDFHGNPRTAPWSIGAVEFD